MISWFTRNTSSKETGGRFYYGWVVLAALLIISIVSYGIRFSFGVFFQPLADDFGWTRATTSGVFSIYLILSGVFAVLGGWAVDRYGPRAIFTVMGFFTGVSLLLTSQASAPWHFFLSYSVLLAIGTGAGYTIMMSTVSRWFTRRRGLAIGIVGSGVGIGQMTIVPIAAWLIAQYSWHTSYFIMAFIALFTIIPSALLLKRHPGGATATPKGEKPDYGTPKEFSISQAAKTKNFWHLISIYFLHASNLFLITTHIVPHAIDLGIASVRAASILSIFGGSGILGKLIIGRVSDSINKKQVLIFCALFMAGAMFLLSESTNLLMLYLFAVIFGLAYGGFEPPIVALLGDIFGLRHIGVIIGVFSAAWGGGSAFGPFLGGYLFDTNGSYTTAFLGGMAAMLIVAILVPFLKIPEPAPLPSLEGVDKIRNPGQ